MVANEKDKHVENTLTQLGISFRRVDHPAVFTVEEVNRLEQKIEGTGCKNLFLKDKRKNAYYLLVLEDTKRANLSKVAGQVNAASLKFASEEELSCYLGLERGAVTPFGLLNDKEKAVTLLLDRDLQSSELVGFHPNINTATLILSFPDFLEFVVYTGNPMMFVDVI